MKRTEGNSFSMQIKKDIYKKIGIMTFYSKNYGTCLQAFALQQILSELGYKVEIISFCRQSAKEKNNKIKNLAIILLKYPIWRWGTYLKVRNVSKMQGQKFDRFKTKRLFMTKQLFYDIDSLHLIDNNYAFFVCGSDMIWSTEFEQYNDVYFLTWCSKEKRISYAPSFGSVVISDELKESYKKYLEDIRFLSCRERSGCKLIKETSGREAEWVLDPTLLINKEGWRKLFDITPSILSRPYILINCFGGVPDNFYKQIEKIKKAFNADIRYLNDGDIAVLNETKFGDGSYGPEEFLQLYSSASFIIANGYHGLLFALIFEKPFILLHRDKDEHWGKHEERMQDILLEFELQDRYINANANITQNVLSIDYTMVREKIQMARKKSLEYLKDALNH